MSRAERPIGRTIVHRNPDVSARDLKGGEGALLLHRVSGEYHRLNRTGALIWRALEHPAPLEEILRRLRAEMGEVPSTLGQDLAAYVVDLAHRDLVRLEDP